MNWAAIFEWFWTVEYLIDSFFFGLAIIILAVIQHRDAKRGERERQALMQEQNELLARIAMALEGEDVQG